jgi:hypothetical protein
MQWNSKQDDGRPYEGVPRLVGEGKHQQHQRCKDEQDRQQWVAPYAVRPHGIGFAPTEDEDRTGGKGVEEPLAEDRQRKSA